MGKRYTRTEVLQRLNQEVSAGRPLYTVGVGTGISAKFVEAGGADLVVTYPIAKFRMAGHSSMAGYLPLCDNNAITLEMGEREIFPIIKNIPVTAGLLGADPTRDMSRLLDKVIEAGFSGILNCPTLALVDGLFRVALEETGLGFAKEIEMIRLARQKELFTHAFCSNTEEAMAMLDVGCDMIVAHMGNSGGGTIGSKTIVTLDDAVEKIKRITDAVKSHNPAALVICHGGPVARPSDFAYVRSRISNLAGFMGGSAGERFPVETGITEVTRQYKSVAAAAVAK
jgi:predicted TIM-barrel enzyme